MRKDDAWHTSSPRIIVGFVFPRPYFFFEASHLPVIWPPTSNSPTSFPSLTTAVMLITPCPVSNVKLSLFAVHVPLLSAADPCAESEDPVTLSPSSLSFSVNGRLFPPTSAAASHSALMRSPP